MVLSSEGGALLDLQVVQFLFEWVKKVNSGKRVGLGTGGGGASGCVVGGRRLAKRKVSDHFSQNHTNDFGAYRRKHKRNNKTKKERHAGSCTDFLTVSEIVNPAPSDQDAKLLYPTGQAPKEKKEKRNAASKIRGAVEEDIP